ncbi:hypothetical protein AAHE18_17G033200 [Arachis hypogaea]
MTPHIATKLIPTLTPISESSDITPFPRSAFHRVILGEAKCHTRRSSSFFVKAPALSPALLHQLPLSAAMVPFPNANVYLFAATTYSNRTHIQFLKVAFGKEYWD